MSLRFIVAIVAVAASQAGLTGCACGDPGSEVLCCCNLGEGETCTGVTGVASLSNCPQGECPTPSPTLLASGTTPSPTLLASTTSTTPSPVVTGDDDPNGGSGASGNCAAAGQPAGRALTDAADNDIATAARDVSGFCDSPWGQLLTALTDLTMKDPETAAITDPLSKAFKFSCMSSSFIMDLETVLNPIADIEALGEALKCLFTNCHTSTSTSKTKAPAEAEPPYFPMVCMLVDPTEPPVDPTALNAATSTKDTTMLAQFWKFNVLMEDSLETLRYNAQNCAEVGELTEVAPVELNYLTACANDETVQLSRLGCNKANNKSLAVWMDFAPTTPEGVTVMTDHFGDVLNYHMTKISGEHQKIPVKVNVVSQTQFINELKKNGDAAQSISSYYFTTQLSRTYTVEESPYICTAPLTAAKKKSKSSCFSADSFVQTDAGVNIPISDIVVGDRLQSVAADGSIVYEEVYGFGHKDASTETTFIRVEVKRANEGSRYLELTPRHWLHSGATCCSFEQLVEAQHLNVGDTVWITNSANELIPSAISNLTRVHRMGIYNPLTRSSTLIVNGVLASNFANIPSWWSPAAQHQLYLPYRALASLLPASAIEWLHHSESGALPCMGESLCARMRNLIFGNF